MNTFLTIIWIIIGFRVLMMYKKNKTMRGLGWISLLMALFTVNNYFTFSFLSIALIVMQVFLILLIFYAIGQKWEKQAALMENKGLNLELKAS